MFRNWIFRKILMPAFSLLICVTLLSNSHLTSIPVADHIIKWVIEKNSTLRVEGKSNINDFTCDILGYAGKDTIICVSDSPKEVKLHGNLQMDVIGFTCNSGIITKGLRKTLKVHEYPKMIIRFLSLQSMPLLQNENELISGCLEVELAGVVKRFDLNYTFSRASPGYLQLNGGRKFCFSDFNLDPPRKLGGLIKVDNNFKVNFQLILRAI